MNTANHSKEIPMAATTTIHIPAGTIVARGWNRADGKSVEGDTIELRGDVFVEATRHEDGAWGYMIAGSRFAYVCPGGCAQVVVEAGR